MVAAAEFHGLTKVYRGGLPGRGRRVMAVEDVTLSVQSGEVFGILGPNRAGKTTLVKLLLTLCWPDSGTVRRFGRPGSDRRTLAQVGYMHENQAFPRYWTARGLLHYYAALGLVAESVAADRVADLIGRVGLEDRADEPIRQFSKGMVQRLALAQALVNDPDLLVLDEPTEGLDLDGRTLVHQVVRSRREQGKSVILVSHLTGDVEALCDRVGVLAAGRVRYVGPVGELCRGRSLEDSLRSLYQAEPS